jgi:hypothetical protein
MPLRAAPSGIVRRGVTRHLLNRLNDALALELAAGLDLVRIRFLSGNTNLDYLHLRLR